jgi:ribosome recycling factor
MPGLSPQRIDGNTLKIPVSRPTAEQRAQILRNLSTTIESAKQQLRTARSEGMKALGGRGAGGTEDVQEMADGFGGELDGVLSKARKEFEKA